MKSNRHVLVVGSDPELLQGVGQAVRSIRNVSLEIARGENLRSLSGKAASAAAVVLQVDLASPEAIERFQVLAWTARDGKVIAAARGAEGEQVRRLFRAGAADVLTGPFDGDAVRGSLHELLQATPGIGPLNGAVVSVVKGCGGAGATTVALNLAGALAQGDPKRARPPRSTAVLDLDLQFGDADVALDLAPRSTVVDVLRAKERVDPRFLEGVMADHASGLKLLAAPPTLVPLEAMSADFALDLVEHAAATFERTFIDLPAAWTDWTVPVLSRSDLIVLVAAPSVAGALGARRVLDALKDAAVQRPVLLVINRLAGLLDSLDRPGRIGRTLEAEVDASLALDAACAKAADRGQLVIDAFPKSALARELRALVGKVDGRIQTLSAGLAFTEVAA